MVGGLALPLVPSLAAHVVIFYSMYAAGFIVGSLVRAYSPDLAMFVSVAALFWGIVSIPFLAISLGEIALVMPIAGLGASVANVCYLLPASNKSAAVIR